MTKAEDNFDIKKQEFNKQLDSYQLNPDENTILLYNAIINLLNSANNTILLGEAKWHIKNNFSVNGLDWDTFKNNVMLANLEEITKSMHNRGSSKVSSFKIDRSNLFKDYNLNGGFKKKSKKRKKRRKKSRKKIRKKRIYK